MAATERTMEALSFVESLKQYILNQDNVIQKQAREIESLHVKVAELEKERQELARRLEFLQTTREAKAVEVVPYHQSAESSNVPSESCHSQQRHHQPHPSHASYSQYPNPVMQSPLSVQPTDQRMRWSDAETKVLIEIWRQRYKETKKARNAEVWESIAERYNSFSLKHAFSPRTGAQCKIKIKNMTEDYRRVRDIGQRTGVLCKENCKYYDVVDSVVNEHTPEVVVTDVRHNVEAPERLPDSSPDIVTVTIPGTPEYQNVEDKEQEAVDPGAFIQAQPVQEGMASESGEVHDARIPENVQEHVLPESKSDLDIPKMKPPSPKRLKTKHSGSEAPVVQVLEKFVEQSQVNDERLIHHFINQQKESEERQQKFTMNMIKELAHILKK